MATVAQSTRMVEVLRPYAEMDDKSVFLVDPVIGPTDAKDCAFICVEVERCATRAGADYVPVMRDPATEMHDIHINHFFYHCCCFERGVGVVIPPIQ